MNYRQIKVVLIGNTGVGKTTIIRNALGELNRDLNLGINATLGVEVHPFTFRTTTQGIVIVNMWDCGGDPRYEGGGPEMYSDGMDVVVGMFDPTYQETKDSLCKRTGRFYPFLKNAHRQGTKIVLVPNLVPHREFFKQILRTVLNQPELEIIE